MTREEKIEGLYSLKEYLVENPIEIKGHKSLPITLVDYAIESLEQEPRWIPISEGVPKDRREVLVTAYWHETYQVMIASYYGDGLWWCAPFNNCGEHMQRLKPKAWMALPKPYRAESEEV